MPRRVLPLALIIVVISLSGLSARALGQAVAPPRTFLPLVHSPVPPLEVVVTASGVDCGPCYPSYSYVRGYLRAAPGVPIARVTLAVDLTHHPYVSPGQPYSGPYTTAAQFAPVFAVTLPGQPNPFGYSVGNGKGFTDVSDHVRIAELSPITGTERYYPLTAVSWERVGNELSGIVRNDSSKTLQDLRAGVLGPDQCGWWPVSLNTATLQPGQTATFQLRYSCQADTLEILGQGVAP